jgi:hypothetical protein
MQKRDKRQCGKLTRKFRATDGKQIENEKGRRGEREHGSIDRAPAIPLSPFLPCPLSLCGLGTLSRNVSLLSAPQRARVFAEATFEYEELPPLLKARTL